jgi:geranylgeranyl diphosphate synthase type I
MALETFLAAFLPAIEEELQSVVAQADGPGLDELREMLAYHLGWEGEGAGPEARGKRIRPVLVLLSAAAAGGPWEPALPVAAAVELVHNFSLIHDDIEDNSDRRRGRTTIWKKWGLAQGVNSGDTMFALSHLALLRLEASTPPAVVLRAARILLETCLQLTQGQFLDLSYEARGDLTLPAYWPMVSGKTAALLAAATSLGALAGGAGESAISAYREFGRTLGLAFQAQDDLLGIWGDAALTGKSAESDLLSGKKSLPVLFGLDQGAGFAARWSDGAIRADEVPALAELLEREGARAYTQETANRLTRQALDALASAQPQGEAGEALQALALRLVSRNI